MSSVKYIEFENTPQRHKKYGCAKAAVLSAFFFTGQDQFQAYQMVTPLNTILTTSRNLS